MVKNEPTSVTSPLFPYTPLKQERAVSPVIATMLLLMIGIVIFAVVYLNVMEKVQTIKIKKPIPHLVCWHNGNEYIIEHQGGECTVLKVYREDILFKEFDFCFSDRYSFDDSENTTIVGDNTIFFDLPKE